MDSVRLQRYYVWTRFSRDANFTVIVRKIFQLHLNFSWDADDKLFRELLTSKHMFLTHYCQPTLNTPIICQKDFKTILELRKTQTLTTVNSSLDCCKNTLINFNRIFLTIYIKLRSVNIILNEYRIGLDKSFC